ncbi:MAG: sulfatase-like hydrolase/transferase [Kiritimatiellia bacterium]
MHKAPDVLVIMPDQLRGDCLSIAGHPVVKTPALDEIGRQGTYFDAAYTTCASCVPARRALLTGQHPSTNGMVGYKGGYRIPGPTLPQILSDNGYMTAMIGRYMHQSPYEEPHGFQTRVLASTHVDNDEYATALKARYPEIKSLRNLGVTFNGWGAKPWEFDDEMHPTAWVTRRSRDFLTVQSADRPLFLLTSFYAPHPPLLPPKTYFDRYYRQDLPEPFYGDWNSNTPGSADEVRMDSPRVHLTGDPLRRAQAGYFGLISHIDDQVAPLIREFKERSEQAGRPWIIMLISDHGEMLGDHNYFRKCEPYEGSSRIPFLIQGSPQLGWQPGQTCRTPVCLEDVMPTVLAAAGIAAPGGIDGKSLLSVLAGQAAHVRTRLHCEHAKTYSQEQAYHFLTDGIIKYIWRPLNGEEQLFHLRQSRGERHNLADHAEWAEVLVKWREYMIQTLRDRPEGFTDGQRLMAGREYKPVLPFLEQFKV